MSKTALYDNHVNLGGKIVDFFGWELPVQYTSIINEHNAVRSKAGLFDVSHMGEITVSGNGAQDFIQHLVTNDISKISDNQIMYSPMCFEDGGVVDDLLIYKFDSTTYLLVVNASNADKDYEWITSHIGKYDVTVENKSNYYSQIAIQGPLANDILQKTTDYDLNTIKFYHFTSIVEVNGCNAIVSRTGYTGEDGFEIYIKNEDAGTVWDALLENGSDAGLVPCGLGARDTLRFEAALPLYGHELSTDINPIEAGLKFFVKLDKEDFIGKQALQAYKDSDKKRKIVGLEMIDRGVPRQGYEIFSGDKKIGFVTSGGRAPSIDKNVALGLIDSEFANLDDEVLIQVRKKQLKAKIIKKPFNKKNYKK